MGAEKRYIAALLFLCMLLIGGCKDGGGGSKATPEPALHSEAEAVAEAKEYVESVGDKAIPFTLTTFSGATFSLEESIGSPVVLNLWASWCGPCKYEAPALQRAYETYKDRGVHFVGVAIQDSVEDSQAFIERFGWTFPAGPDETGDIMKAYRVMAIPKTYIIDKRGLVSYIHVGAIDEATITRELDRLL